MGVVFEAGYTLPGGDEPLTHARIAHSGNWLSGGTVTASSTATDFFADGPTNSLTYEKWKGTAAATWEYDHGGASECDYCVIGAHTMGTDGATFTVQYWDGATWQNVSPATSPADNMPIMVIFAPETRQRWRLNITAGTPEIGVIKFGKALQMQRALYGGHAPLDLSRQTILRSTYSESGEFLGRTKQRTYFETSFQWDNLTAAWVRTNWRPLQVAIACDPFFIAWRPGDFSEVGLVQTEQTPIPSNQGQRDLMSVSLSVRGYGYD